uniref:Uncharacterized protein n=1 Tax=Anguilla anguilla TaxID=7936 RepID=A0A0E9VDA7_ANGAN
MARMGDALGWKAL